MSLTKEKTTKRQPKKFDGLTIGLVIVVTVLGLAAAVAAFILVRNLVNGWSMTALPGAPQIAEVQDTAMPSSLGSPVAQAPVKPQQGPTPIAWDGAGRVTVLVMGKDYRDWLANDIPRTDSMLLLTLDPLSNTAGILSIPRDMWVDIPGFDYGKINTAYFLGESYKLPGGGAGLAVKTVEEFLGVPINFYTVIDFEAFSKFVDDIGGIDVKVCCDMDVDPIGPGNTIHLRAGVQTLDGAHALAYARARHTDGGDFDRANRQQDVLMALRKNIIQLNMMPTLIKNGPKIYSDISSGLQTNMTLDQAIRLALLATKVESVDIRKGVIGPPLQIIFGKSPDGLDIDIPIHDQIRILRDQIFTTGGPVSPAAVSNDPNELIKQEGARIAIQNGTQDPGLAERTGQYLISQGLNVIGVLPSQQSYPNTTMIIVNGKPYAAKFLSDTMKISTASVYSRFQPDGGFDIQIILGSDWAAHNPMP